MPCCFGQSAGHFFWSGDEHPHEDSTCEVNRSVWIKRCSVAMVCRDRRMDVNKSNRGTLSVRSLRQSSDGIDISELEKDLKMIEASLFSVDYTGDLMLWRHDQQRPFHEMTIWSRCWKGRLFGSQSPTSWMLTMTSFFVSDTHARRQCHTRQERSRLTGHVSANHPHHPPRTLSPINCSPLPVSNNTLPVCRLNSLNWVNITSQFSNLVPGMRKMLKYHKQRFHTHFKRVNLYLRIPGSNIPVWFWRTIKL